MVLVVDQNLLYLHNENSGILNLNNAAEHDDNIKFESKCRVHTDESFRFILEKCVGNLLIN